MTKLKKQFEVTVHVAKENGRLQEIADIVVRYYKEASVKAQLWKDDPVSYIIVISDEKTLRKLVSTLRSELEVDVEYRLAPHYLYN